MVWSCSWSSTRLKSWRSSCGTTMVIRCGASWFEKMVALSKLCFSACGTTWPKQMNAAWRDWRLVYLWMTFFGSCICFSQCFCLFVLVCQNGNIKKLPSMISGTSNGRTSCPIHLSVLPAWTFWIQMFQVFNMRPSWLKYFLVFLIITVMMYIVLHYALLFQIWMFYVGLSVLSLAKTCFRSTTWQWGELTWWDPGRWSDDGWDLPWFGIFMIF